MIIYSRWRGACGPVCVRSVCGGRVPSVFVHRMCRAARQRQLRAICDMMIVLVAWLQNGNADQKKNVCEKHKEFRDD